LEEQIAFRFEVEALHVRLHGAAFHAVPEHEADDESGQDHPAGAEPIRHDFSTISRTRARYGSSTGFSGAAATGATSSFFAFETTSTNPMARTAIGRIQTS